MAVAVDLLADIWSRCAPFERYRSTFRREWADGAFEGAADPMQREAASITHDNKVIGPVAEQDDVPDETEVRPKQTSHIEEEQGEDNN